MSFVDPELKLGSRDFSRAFLDTPEPDTLHPGATPDARNCFLFGVESGSNVFAGGEFVGDKRRAHMGRRKGAQLLNPTAIAAAVKIDGLWEYTRENAAGALLAACNGAWYQYDEVSTFNPVTGATGFTAGNSARIATFKNQAVLYDGTLQQVYDGGSVRPMGFGKPTGVTALGVAAGPGVTGTYTARYTWYDQTHDHESTAADGATASQAYTNQQRIHTKPSGAPPANVTHWRAYVRREDIAEFYWFLVATVAVATATFTEAIVDGARVQPLPVQVSYNDPPTVNFAVLTEWNGYAIGFPVNSSTLYASAQGDFESWNPKDQFKVSAGDGRPVKSAIKFGTEIVLQKPHKSWHIANRRVPFDIEPLQGSMGNVSQESAIEVGGRLYAWDEVQGPYWTDLGANWVAIGNLTILNFLKNSINLQALDDIRAVHDETRNLIIWAVPTVGSTRKRTLLAYHYLLGAWLPPITGLEYAALTRYRTTAGTLGIYVGDYWGRVYQYFQSDREGLPTNATTATIQSTVTAATANTLTDTTATFYTTGSGMAGMQVAVVSPAGDWQWRRIQSNTATVITLDTTNDAAWTTIPSAGWTYIIAGIQGYWVTPILDGGMPATQKRAHWLTIQQVPAPANYSFTILARFGGVSNDLTEQFKTQVSGALWGIAIWGTSLWGGGATARPMSKLRLLRSPFSMQFRFQFYYPDQPIEITSYEVGCDLLKRRRVRGAA